MRIAVAREQALGEARVAMVPDLVGKLRAAGYDVAVQAGAGGAALLRMRRTGGGCAGYRAPV